MKLLVIGSMTFAKDMVKMQKLLKKIGHTVRIPDGTEPHLTNSSFTNSLEENLQFCIDNNIMKRNFDLVVEQDAVLVLNHKRNGTDGYIGVSALMEMAIAHHFNKKIFVYNKLPDYNIHRWAHEVAIMQPVVIDGDISKIK